LEHPWVKMHHDDTLLTNIDEGIVDSLRNFTSSSPLEKEIMFYLAKISSESEILKLKKAFLEIDKDNTGTIEMEEVIEIFDKMGIKRTKVN
jgi:Ca2+-binding EF-hand superfamily protein